MVGSLKMNTALEYSTRVVQEGDRRCKKSTVNDLAYLTPLRIPLMNSVYGCLTLFLLPVHTFPKYGDVRPFNFLKRLSICFPTWRYGLSIVSAMSEWQECNAESSNRVASHSDKAPKNCWHEPKKYNFQKNEKFTKKRSQTCSLCTICGLISWSSMTLYSRGEREPQNGRARIWLGKKWTTNWFYGHYRGGGGGGVGGGY